MKLEISLPPIPWKRVGIAACVIALILYWWVAVRPYLHINQAILRVATTEIFVSSPGIVTAKIWEEGDLFQKGELLSSLTSEPVTKDVGGDLQTHQDLLTEERATLEQTMQGYIQAQAEGQPSEVIDQILLRVQRTQQSIVSAEEAIARLKSQKSESTASQEAVLAPFDGMILRSFKQNGQWAAVGEPVFTICDRSKIWVEATVPERWLNQLKVGQLATVSFPSFAGRQWQAKIERISSVVEQGCVRLRLTAPDLPLRPGLSAQVTLRVH